MATADFTATDRVGDGSATVTFTDASTGTIVSRKWILGDGTVIDGNLTSVVHTYSPGTYDVILVVEDLYGQDSKTRTGYVVVNQIHPRPSFVIAESFGSFDDEYWRFYLDSELHLVYEDKDYVYRSVDPVTTIKKWTFVEFHAGLFEMYAGTYSQTRHKVDVAKSVNASPPVITDNVFYIAPNSTIKIDEFKIWLGEKNLKSYYYQTRPMAGSLDA
jgi:PKD repeat protein